MTWLTWRQSRGQLLAALVLIVVAAAYLIWVGYRIRTAYNTDVLGCTGAGCGTGDAADRFIREHSWLVAGPSYVLIALPAVLGIFWGAPMIAREIEIGTHRLVWNQSVTRTRWLAVKLAVVGLAAVLITAVLSGLLTWAASRYDELQGTRFETLSFASRNIAPLGYTVFAIILGATIGLFLRRTLPAMALTLLVVGLVQIALPAFVRPHLGPVTESIPYSRIVELDTAVVQFSRTEPLRLVGYTVPGALMLTYTADLRDTSGDPVTGNEVPECLPPAVERDAVAPCLSRYDLHFDVMYQPAGRYWPFQWMEFAAFLALAALLAAASFWRIRHVSG